MDYEYLKRSIRRRFDNSSTALDVLQGLDLQGKVALVTGSNTGIGFETARSLALHNCKVIFACRNVEKAKKAISIIQEEKNDVDCDILELDLTSLSSVQVAAERFNQKYRTLNILILNAGVGAISYELTEDNYETTFQVNHLAQFYFTLLLKASLHKCPGSRVVIVSSIMHMGSYLTKPAHLQPSILSPSWYKYWYFMAYSNSKLCNILFGRELAKRWPDVIVSMLDPGSFINSDITRYSWLSRILFIMTSLFSKSLEQGASTTVYCATAPELEQLTGTYFSHCFPCKPTSTALKSEMASKLWSVSEEMIDMALEKKKSK